MPIKGIRIPTLEIITKLKKFTKIGNHQIKRPREDDYSFGSLEKWALQQAATRTRSKLPFDLLQAVLWITDSLLHHHNH